MTRTEPTLRRALALDPNLEDAEQQIVSLLADAGKLVEAYKEAKGMVEQRPKSGFAHFTLSYVLRYAGMIKETQQECETAIRLDPGNFQFRSCSAVFSVDGKQDQARQFSNLDAGSEWSNNVEVHFLLREGKVARAVELAHSLPDSHFFHNRAIEACYSPATVSGSEQVLQQAAKEIETYRDPEPRFSQGGVLNHCLGNRFTGRVLQGAIRDGFCAYDYLPLDPLLAEFRKSSDYPPLLAQAKQCHDNFLAQRDK